MHAVNIIIVLFHLIKGFILPYSLYVHLLFWS